MKLAETLNAHCIRLERKLIRRLLLPATINLVLQVKITFWKQHEMYDLQLLLLVGVTPRKWSDAIYAENAEKDQYYLFINEVHSF